MMRVCTRSLVPCAALARLAVLTAAFASLAEPLWSQRSAKINDKDCDGYADIVIGRPKEDIGAFIDCGAATAMYGSGSGLTTTGSENINMDVLGSTLAAGDFFGASVAYGFFDANGYADTAIGVPGRDGAFPNQGMVVHAYGNINGLGLLPLNPLPQFIFSTATPAQANAQFGRVLSSGDFNGDGADDLAVGIPLQNVGGAMDAGAVEVLYGSAAGLGSPESWHQNTAGILDSAEAGDRFGAALASGDFDGDGVDDLAIGVPNEETGAIADAGAVCILYGGPLGLAAAGNQLLTASAANPQPGERFGAALAGGDFDGDLEDDLVIGIPMNDVGAAGDAGAVEVVYGSAAGLAGAQRWNQNSAGVPGSALAGDRFGSSLSSEDYNGDGFRDMLAGIPTKNSGATSNCGAVCVMYGSLAGVGAGGSLEIFSTACGIEAMAQFGYEVASADYNADNFIDVCTGVPLDDVGAVADSGSVEVLHGSAAGIFTGAICINQDTPGLASDGSQAGDAFGGALEQ